MNNQEIKIEGKFLYFYQEGENIGIMFENNKSFLVYHTVLKDKIIKIIKKGLSKYDYIKIYGFKVPDKNYFDFKIFVNDIDIDEKREISQNDVLSILEKK